jgi:RHS repeat-associated protein
MVRNIFMALALVFSLIGCGGSGSGSDGDNDGDVNRAPTAGFTATPASGNMPLAVAFNGSGSSDPDGDTMKFSWDFGDGSHGSGQIISHTYTGHGVFEAVLTVTDSPGAVGTARRTISVNAPPLASFSTSAVSGEAPLTVNYDATGSTDPDGSISAFSWDFGDGVTGSGQTVSHTFLSAGTYSVTLTVTDNSSATGTATTNIAVLSPVPGALPPDPSDVATVISASEATRVGISTAFLYTGATPIQTGVDPMDIDPLHMAVLRGSVKDRNGAPLPGVTITILNHPEYGQTLTRLDGMFDLVVNGGMNVAVVYRKENFLTVHRRTDTPWQDFVWLPEVIMIPIDTAATTIDFSEPIQVARGTKTSDARGERNSTLLFSGGTTAQMVLPGGATQKLATMTVRSTEYTQGDSGPMAMPGLLPHGVAYTYAAELSVDEAMAAGADTVVFSKPVFHYVENFINFPVGEIVPTYYFDRSLGTWRAMAPGVVIGIVSKTGGVADIDADGDGLAEDVASLDALGMTTEERRQLATLYTEGQTLWRVPLSHFTAVDYNWPPELPPDATIPNPPPPSNGDVEEDSCETSGSIVECQGQVLGKRLPLSGTPFTMNYRSDGVPGHGSSYILDIPLVDAVYPTSLEEVRLEITVAGRRFEAVFTNLSMWALPYRFEWDGLDAYGREVKGRLPVKVRIGYSYPAVYRCSSSGCSADPMLGLETLWREWKGWTGRWASSAGLGGWSIDVHHAWDPGEGILHLGDGRRQSAVNKAYEAGLFAGCGYDECPGLDPDDGLPANLVAFNNLEIALGPDASLVLGDDNRVFRLGPDGILVCVAGTGDYGFAGDGGPAKDALFYQIEGLAVAPDGSIFVCDYRNHRIRKITPDGIVNTIAGTGAISDFINSGTFSGDGGPAIEAGLYNPLEIVLDSDGTLYFWDSGNRRIRRIGPDGIITTVAGNGSTYTYGCRTGIQATATGLSGGITLALDKKGRVLLTDSTTYCVRRIEADGKLAGVAGTGVSGFSGDGGPAELAQLQYPNCRTVDSDGSIYISGGNRLRRVGPDGIISTIAGNGEYGGSLDNGPALEAAVGNYGEAVAPDRSIYITDNRRIVRIVPAAVSAFSFMDVLVPSSDGSEIYSFNSQGRHIQTLDAVTGTLKFNFSYDGEGFLAGIEDAFGNSTVIERNGAGLPTAIVGPHGHRTALSMNSDGYLSSMANPMGETWSFDYGNGGLLTRAADPEDNASLYAYDDQGKLVETRDAAGGGQVLARHGMADADGYEVTRTTAEGRIIRYRVENLEEGGILLSNISDCCGQGDLLVGLDGSRTHTSPDGTETVTRHVPDPRFGRGVSIPSTITVTTPGGLERSVDFTRAVVLDDPGDFMTLTRQTDTISINGRVFTRDYDAATGVMTTTSPQGRQRISVSDETGNIVETRLVGLERTQYAYDPEGRLSRVVFGAGGNARTFNFAYGPHGYLSGLTGPLGFSVALDYDAAGRPASVTAPNGDTVAYARNAAGGLSAVTPPDRPAHEFLYNAVGLLWEYQPPILGSAMDTVYSYDLDRKVTRIDRPDGKQISFSYDAVGRLAFMGSDDGNITMGYDAGGRLASISRGGQNLTFAYDGFLNTETAWTGNVSGTLTFDYNDDFRMTSQILNGGYPISFVYDNDGLLISAGDLSLTRDAQTGLVMGTTLGSTITTTTFNGFGEIATHAGSLGGSPVFAQNFERDGLGRILRKHETIEGTATTFEYAYDMAGRLTSVSKNSAVVETYGYGANGNRTLASGVPATYDTQDRLVQYGDLTYAYSHAGELIQKTDTESGENTRYQYDGFGSLLSVELPDGKEITYGVDGMNRRVARYVNGILVQGFLYQDDLNPLAELDGSGSVISRFIYGSRSNIPEYMVRGGITYRIFADPLGSPRLVMNTNNGSVAQRMDFDAFGRVIHDSNPGFQPFGFAGGLYDSETGLVRFGARDYDAQAGRWTAKDPIRFAGGDTNFYVYAANDPVNRVDPTGLACTNQSLIDNYLQGLRDILALQREQGRLETGRQALSVLAGTRALDSTERFLDSMTGFFDVMDTTRGFSGGGGGGYSAGGGAPGSAQRARERQEALNQLERIDRRMAEIGLEILAIEQMLELARQNCPCLYETNFP